LHADLQIKGVTVPSKKFYVGLNCDYWRQNGKGYSIIPSSYYDCVLEAEMTPIIFPPLRDNSQVKRQLDTVSAVILVSGGDLDPQNDGFMRHPMQKCMDPRRERYDRMLVEDIRARKIPVLAIGAGMQLLNVACGGTLYYHIPEMVPDAIPHFDAIETDLRHRIDIVADPSFLAEIYRDSAPLAVCSRHHMSVDDVAPGFRVTAKAPDGVIEAIEYNAMRKWFAVGLQFHPHCSGASELDRLLFFRFLQKVQETYE
jgi:putative glutamine amidotransferase